MRSARPDARPGRVAIVGAAGTEGARVREALAECGVPGARVDLFGAASAEAVLSDYDGEARLVQDLAEDSLAPYEVVFLCEPAGRAARPREGLVLDVSGTLPHAPLVHVPLLPPGEGIESARIPHALSIVLAELLASLRSSVRGCRASAVVLRPAAAYGTPGLEELREQAVGLLRFEPPPVEVFGRTLAFNVLPEPRGSDGRADAGRLIARDARTLLGADAPPLALRLATAPVFHGHLLFLRLDGEGLDADRLRPALDGAAGIEIAPPGRPVTPVDAPEDRRTVVFDFEADEAGVWIVAVAGLAESAAARQAVAVALASGRLG